MANIVISYRRDDTKLIAGRIVEKLQADFGKGEVFIDIDKMVYGLDFRDQLRKAIEQCDVLVAIVGPNWLGRPDTRANTRRIADVNDWVHLEIKGALERKIPLIPVLIDDASMPTSTELPEDIQEFAFRQALRLDSGIDFEVHVKRLSKAINQALPAPAHWEWTGVKAKRTFGVAAGLALIVGFVSYLVAQNPQSHDAPASRIGPYAAGASRIGPYEESLTASEIMEFQKFYCLVTDGVFGPATRAAMLQFLDREKAKDVAFPDRITA